jgi:RimJ/RimL family protein N-acetyltransferase
MKYYEKINLKDGRECILRNCTEADGEAVLEIFNLTHEETDNLLSYPDESTLNAEEEASFLKEKEDSDKEIEILAEIDGKIAGLAGLSSIGNKYKICHRVDFGISVAKECWNLGIGSALLSACISCAKKVGYEQIELNVVADNPSAISIYKKAGFEEFGRNPKGFRSRYSSYQELVYMRKEL